MKELSIIIPHYNSVKLLKKLLLTIPIKDEIEVIVIDDNSTKDISLLNDMKKDSSFQHINFLENNLGKNSAGTCRNIGLKRATGKWLLFADADDYFLDGFYSILKQYFNSEYDLIYFTPTSIFMDTKETSNRHLKYENLIKNYLDNKSVGRESELKYSFGPPWSKLIKRELVKREKITFDEVIAWNDMLFSTKVGHFSRRTHATFEKIYCVTRSKGSLTTTTSEEVIDSRIDTFIRYCNFINENVEKKQRQHLNLDGLGKLIMVWKSGFGSKKVIETYNKFRRHNIELVNKQHLNPIFTTRKIIAFIKNHNKEKNYYQK